MEQGCAWNFAYIPHRITSNPFRSHAWGSGHVGLVNRCPRAEDRTPSPLGRCAVWPGGCYSGLHCRRTTDFLDVRLRHAAIGAHPLCLRVDVQLGAKGPTTWSALKTAPDDVLLSGLVPTTHRQKLSTSSLSATVVSPSGAMTTRKAILTISKLHRDPFVR